MPWLGPLAFCQPCWTPHSTWCWHFATTATAIIIQKCVRVCALLYKPCKFWNWNKLTFIQSKLRQLCYRKQVLSSINCVQKRKFHLIAFIIYACTHWITFHFYGMCARNFLTSKMFKWICTENLLTRSFPFYSTICVLPSSSFRMFE